MRFGELAKSQDKALLVGPRHEKWLVEDKPFSIAAVMFAAEQMGKGDRKREGSISASSLGGCQRSQQFTFIGMPKLPYDSRTMLIFQNGTFMHLRWQMSGLTEGWLSEAEVPVGENAFRLSGTMDGLLHDGSILELKSINSNGFSRVQSFGPLHKHLFQMATYMLATNRQKGVFLYEDKNTQEYKEIVVGRNDVPIQEAADTADKIWRDIESKTLAEPLSKCIDKDGYEYRGCPYRDRCLKIKTWEEAEQ